MKKYIILLFVLSLFSCKSKVPIFELYQEVNFIIPAGKDHLATHHFLIHDIPSTLNKTLKSKSIKLSDIKELYAGRGKLESIVYNSNFGIMRNISVWIYKKNDYGNRAEIYYRDDIRVNQRGELKMLSSGEDIRDILISDNYEMDIEVQFKGFTAETIECRMTFSYVGYSE